jgi:catechol 2,3-dioxygenase-like lactoylglutathione lyase family enzyme
MKPILGTIQPCQIAIICRNLEETKKKFAAFLDMPIPENSDGGPYEITGCEYMGKPAMSSSCKMAFFELGNIQLELIEPYGGESTWQEFLDETGGGIHHIAYQVEDIEEGMKKCQEFGMKLTQYGKYNDASGAYAYFNAREQLGCYIELLCTFKK